MKRLVLLTVLMLSATTARAATCQGTPPEVGANYNQWLADVDPGLLHKSGVKWLRAFVNIERNFLTFNKAGRITGVLESNISQPTDSVSSDSENLGSYSISHFVNSKSVLVNGQPIKLILSLKFDFKYQNAGVPNPKSKEMAYLLSAVEQFLKKDNLGGQIDILVVGNEPMFETPVQDAQKFGAFLNLLIEDVDSLKSENPGWNYRIFAGALNKASSMPDDPILQQVIAITNGNPRVAGLDLHEHVASLPEQLADLEFVRTTEKVTKQLISTEFSMVGLWDAHSSDLLGAWGAQHGFGSKTPLFQWIDDLVQLAAMGNAIDQNEFLSYFEIQPWYPAGWFATMFEQFKCQNTYAVTYGIQTPISVPPILYDKTSMLWYVNFVFNCTLFGMGSDGYCNTNPLVFSDFENAVHGM
ncbi:MAG TPA: hypothetical protein VEU51_04415 [Candidatus Acidoferrales bacterium]|nr:hypothetical protein [Candidatus Acidoferrales bacterium]